MILLSNVLLATMRLGYLVSVVYCPYTDTHGIEHTLDMCHYNSTVEV